MSLHTTLGHIRDAAKTFEGGTQIVGPEQAARAGASFAALEDLIWIAQRKGATPYEISRAFQGEVIGESFLTGLVEVP